MSKLPARLRRLWPIIVCLLAFPSGAFAHNTIPGMGEFVNGFLHPLSTPAHLLIIIGLGLLLGQQRPLRLDLPLALFTTVSAAGLLVTTLGLMKVEPPAYLACISLAAGILAAIAMRVPRWAMTMLFAGAAVALSLDSVADAAVTPWAVAKTLFGTWISFIVWIVDIAYYVSLLPPRKWMQIGARVAGSWIVAISFLVLAFALRR